MSANTIVDINTDLACKSFKRNLVATILIKSVASYFIIEALMIGTVSFGFSIGLFATLFVISSMYMYFIFKSILIDQSVISLLKRTFKKA